MPSPSRAPGQGRVAMVLAGGAARGAYEVGVVRHILEDVARALGRDVPIDVLCGTSVGALNTTFLAAAADDPRGRGARLEREWLSLRMGDLIHPDPRAALDFMRSLFGRSLPVDENGARRGGILDPGGIERLVHRAIDFDRIHQHLQKGLVHAVTVSTTHVGSGRTVVFVQSREPLPGWGRDPTIEARAVTLGPEHALASAAIPFIFPAVRIGGHFYCDGGLRQNVPLSPARRLGADGLIVVSPRYIEPAAPPSEVREREAAFPGPLFLLGKALNALLLDRVDNDIDRLERINTLLDAGTRRFGPGFLDAINEELTTMPLQGAFEPPPPGGAHHSPLRTRPLTAVLIRASDDIGRIAGDYVRSPEFARRTPGLVGRAMRRLAEGTLDSDLLSYLLFDGEFAARLIELGRRDAQARHDELCAFFDEMFARREAAAPKIAAQ